MNEFVMHSADILKRFFENYLNESTGDFLKKLLEEFLLEFLRNSRRNYGRLQKGITARIFSKKFLENSQGKIG